MAVRDTEKQVLLASGDWTGEARLRILYGGDALQLEIGQDDSEVGRPIGKKPLKHGFFTLSADDLDEIIALCIAGKQLLGQHSDVRQSELRLVHGGAA